MSEAHVNGRLAGPDYAPRIRAERLIATSRVVLAVFSLIAVWLDPYAPAIHGQTTSYLLLGYLIISLIVAAVVWLAHGLLPRLGLVTHVMDLCLFSVLTYFTEGPTSPFFMFFMFPIVGATLRWHWHGALWTAAAALVGFNGIGLYVDDVLQYPEFEGNRFFIRSVYLAVMAGLLGYLGAYEERRRREMSQLATWPRALPSDPHIPPPEILESAARVLSAPRVLLAWEEPDEPWLRLALWRKGECRSWREAPATFHPVVAPALAGRSFLCKDVYAPMPLVLRSAPDETHRWHGVPVHLALRTRFAMVSVLCLSVHGEHLDGHLFALDKMQMTEDDLLLGEVVAHEVASSMDQALLSRRLRQTAAGEERIRLFRDLHDGVLQSLTGAALQLETVQRLWDTDSRSARERLAAIQRLMVEEQRDLRVLIRDSKLGFVVGDGGLSGYLRDLVRRFEGLWGVHVDLKLDGVDQRSSDALAYDICFIVQEGLVNAARHAAASQVHAGVAVNNGEVKIVVADNGHGFSFQGDFDHATLTALRLGPVMLKRRVESAGGTLRIHSTGDGALLEVKLPTAHRSE